MTSEAFFAEDVESATEKFAQAARQAGAVLSRYDHPSPGPNGEALSTSVALLGPEDPETMLVVVSGTHGIEGYAGSAIQIAALAGRDFDPLAPGLGILFVHLVNPWGCAWNRRENEDNADVFRNLVYDKQPFVRNALYERYEQGINPREWTGPEREKSDRIFQELIDECGMDGAIGVIRKGQHSYPRGVTYHGAGATWSRNVVQQIGRDHLAGVERALVVDIHTGYGASGQASVVPYDEHGPKADFIREHYPDILLIPGSDPLIPSHPKPPYQIWEDGEGPKILFVGLEFGTADVGEAFQLFRANSFIHTYGNPSSDFGRRTSAQYRELFYPSSPQWRDDILRSGLGILNRTVALTERLDRIL
ncbi:DUF2817 domain-containing protein [Sphingosinicella rhizophila]|uniref:DUF2817 domain-containing protein n=1 Tax=Sphingosinicella rhizophila TaxID=3050082 RepID=A0ABU3QAV0_9SPHN|nr:DUF2817 domain-containing protein [Sphingosinicella sp. GR2756]MDT9600494.1 DUF2817 domain-containing protein [Sphingosinicella sp. GR2756]